MKVTIDQNDFIINGKKTKIISGAIHYFRVVPEYWYDRLSKLKACGFNALETYMAWNLHEEQEGHFNFEGMLDIVRFIEIAKELGLYVILRPGPYICSEWEFGGLPAWLLTKPGLKLRCDEPQFISYASRYLKEVFKRVKPLLIENGGNIIMMQVENEYGSYGMDRTYMNKMADLYRQEEMNVFLFTSDGDDDSMLNGGGADGIFKVVNFGSDCARNFTNLRKFQPEGPVMCGEFWNGWFDHWGEEHHVRAADDTAKEFEAILDMGGSVNFYMFHGGTNFNFYNGANHFGTYEPTVTSYDYHCLLNENGDRTAKYYACQDVLRKRGYEVDMIECHEQPKKAYGKVELTQYAPLFDHLEGFTSHYRKESYTLPMEYLGQNFGFILYRTYLKGPFQSRPLKIMGLHDRALVYGNGTFLGVHERDQHSDEILVSVKENEVYQLDILVENMGRVNYGPELYDYKGITKSVLLGLQEIHGWEMFSIELKDFSKIDYQPIGKMNGPALLKGVLHVDEVADTFIYLDGFVKGNVFVNGFNIGRYFNRGPQKSLYIPAPLLKQGENTIEVFELQEAETYFVEFKEVEDLG